MADRKLNPYAFFLVLWALGFGIYSNTLHSDFQYDDEIGIVRNRTIRDLSDIPRLWDAFNTRLITGLTYALNYAAGGLDPLGYHLFNITCHVLSSMLVFVLVTLIFHTPSLRDSPLEARSAWVAAFAALLFLTHPVQTQGVTYLWERSASLATFFCLAAAVMYLKARIHPIRTFYAAALAAAVLAMFTKEIAMTLPILLLFCELILFAPLPLKDRAKRLWFLLPFLLTLVITPLAFTRPRVMELEIFRPETARVVGFEENGEPLYVADPTRWVSSETLPRWDYYRTQLNVIRTYVRLAFFPLRQTLDYGYPIARRWLDPSLIFSALGITGSLVLAWRERRRFPLPSLGAFWFFTAMSVESLIPQKTVIFEHRLYLPLVGFSLFLPALLLALPGMHKTPRAATLIVAIILPLSFLAFRRNEVWKDPVRLWSDVVQRNPDNLTGHYNLGLAMARRKDAEGAAQHFAETLRIDPRNVKAHNNLGVLHAEEGRFGEAVEHYARALSIDPDYPESHNNLANVLVKKSEWRQAAAHYSEALRLRPDFSQAHRNLELMLMKLVKGGRSEEAIGCYLEVLKVHPNTVTAHNNVGVLLEGQGRREEAAAHYSEALRLDPGFEAARHNLEMLLVKKNGSAAERK